MTRIQIEQVLGRVFTETNKKDLPGIEAALWAVAHQLAVHNEREERKELEASNAKVENANRLIEAPKRRGLKK